MGELENFENLLRWALDFVHIVIKYMYNDLFWNFGSEEYHICKVLGIGYRTHHNNIKVFITMYLNTNDPVLVQCH
jgi:hypothetical protein